MDWQGIETAPKDGSVIFVRRLFEGRTVYEGLAVWRTVHFGELRDPINGHAFAEAYDGVGWMYANKDFRVPTPTHWRPDSLLSPTPPLPAAVSDSEG